MRIWTVKIFQQPTFQQHRRFSQEAKKKQDVTPKYPEIYGEFTFQPNHGAPYGQTKMSVKWCGQWFAQLSRSSNYSVFTLNNKIYRVLVQQKKHEQLEKSNKSWSKLRIFKAKHFSESKSPWLSPCFFATASTISGAGGKHSWSLSFNRGHEIWHQPTCKKTSRIAPQNWGSLS